MSDIAFSLVSATGNVLHLGKLSWPYKLKSIHYEGDLVVVKDNKGEAVFSLSDIHLNDLE